MSKIVITFTRESETEAKIRLESGDYFFDLKRRINWSEELYYKFFDSCSREVIFSDEKSSECDALFLEINNWRKQTCPEKNECVLSDALAEKLLSCLAELEEDDFKDNSSDEGFEKTKAKLAWLHTKIQLSLANQRIQVLEGIVADLIQGQAMLKQQMESLVKSTNKEGAIQSSSQTFFQ